TASFDYRFAPSFTLKNPDGDAAGRITLAELEVSPADELVQVNIPAATLVGTIDSDATLGTWSAVDQTLILSLRDFSALQFTVDPADDLDATTGYDEILNFVNADVTGVLNLLDGLGARLQKIADAINTPVPFTSAGTKVVLTGTVGSLDSTKLREVVAAANPNLPTQSAAYVGALVRITGGTLQGQRRKVVPYAPGTRTFTLESAFSPDLAVGTTFEIQQPATTRSAASCRSTAPSTRRLGSSCARSP